MLQRMFLGDPPGNYDRILDFSSAVTGSLFFVPTADFLDDPPPLPGEGEGEEGDADESGGSADPDLTVVDGSRWIARDRRAGRSSGPMSAGVAP